VVLLAALLNRFQFICIDEASLEKRISPTGDLEGCRSSTGR